MKKSNVFGWWYFSIVLLLSSILFACSGGTNYVGTGTTQAVGAESYTVTFETNGGSTVTKQVVASGGVAELPSESPTKTGSEFIGWYADSGFSAKYNFTTPITADTTVYARWWDATGFVLADGKTVGETAGSNVFVSGRTVDIAKLWASDHEVTQGEYETYCIYGENAPSASTGVGTDYPTYNVSWYDALVYCNKRSMTEGLTPCYTINGSSNPTSWPGIVDDGAGKLCGPSSTNTDWDNATCDFSANGYRLPTEAEWEMLARGGDPNVIAWNYTYSGSNTIDDVAWCMNSDGTIHEVKQNTANSKGLYDMSGNISEWCWDRYGTVDTSTPATGNAFGSFRVFRGGSWYSYAPSCAVSYRDTIISYFRSISFSIVNFDVYTLGFRVVRTAQ